MTESPSETVARLQDIYQKHLPEAPPGSLRYTAEFCQASINAMPELLDVMGEIRAGDADSLRELLHDLPSLGYTSDLPSMKLLRRYQAMAAKMEASE